MSENGLNITVPPPAQLLMDEQALRRQVQADVNRITALVQTKLTSSTSPSVVICQNADIDGLARPVVQRSSTQRRWIKWLPFMITTDVVEWTAYGQIVHDLLVSAGYTCVLGEFVTGCGDWYSVNPAMVVSTPAGQTQWPPLRVQIPTA